MERIRQSESEEEHYYRAHHRALADPEDLEDLDFSSYGEETVSRGYIADAMPATSTEPIQYMKHDTKRHKRILAERKKRRGGKRKGKGSKLDKKARKALKEHPKEAKKAKKAAREIAETDT